MKLTKVLVGLLAVSLCGAVGAVKKTTRSVGVDTRAWSDKTASEMYSMFRTEIGKTPVDAAKLTALFDAIMTRIEGRGLLASSLQTELDNNPSVGLSFGALRDAWRAKKSVVVTKRIEDTGKAGAWPAAWGDKPDLSSDAKIDAEASTGALAKARNLRKTMTAEEKAIFNKWVDDAFAKAVDPLVKQGLGEDFKVK